LALAAAAVVLLAPAAGAQTFPQRPVKLIVPFAAGGSADVYARIIAQHLTSVWPQPVVVENRPGAGAVVGTDAAAKSAPDGHTLLMMSNTQTVNETLIPGKPYNLLRDFAPITEVNSSDLVMVVHPAVAAKTLKEFIALAQSKPGALNYASSGPGTPYHMAGELFKHMSKTDIVHIPYSGSAGARNDVLGGHVQMMFDAITTMSGLIGEKQLTALMVTGPKRSSVLPDVPTAAEAGLPGYEATIWLGLMVPIATPKPIVEKINADVVAFLKKPETIEQWGKQGADPAPLSPDQFGTFIASDIKKWGDLITQANIKVQ
jgi:tripartite-type tricarboxylate transporter receptor subunit TctC